MCGMEELAGLSVGALLEVIAGVTVQEREQLLPFCSFFLLQHTYRP